MIGLAAAGLPRSSAARPSWSGSSPPPCCASCSRGRHAASGDPRAAACRRILLLWVCWKMWRECAPDVPSRIWKARRRWSTRPRSGREDHRARPAQASGRPPGSHGHHVSMSLDDVLAVAGAAREHPVVLVFGLGLSIALMGIAASFHRPPAAAPPLDRLCRASPSSSTSPPR